MQIVCDTAITVWMTVMSETNPVAFDIHHHHQGRIYGLLMTFFTFDSSVVGFVVINTVDIANSAQSY